MATTCPSIYLVILGLLIIIITIIVISSSSVSIISGSSSSRQRLGHSRHQGQQVLATC
jgi:hypothetical protein